MDSRQAREILTLYRPGSMDAIDPQVAEALEVVRHDSELAAWFDQHCAVCVAIRGKLRQIPVPADLKRRIIVERAQHARTIRFPARVKLLLAAAAVVVLAAVGWFLFAPPKETAFAHFRLHMAGMAQRGYNMDFFAKDQNQIRAQFIARNAPVDYDFAKTLQALPAEGGAITKFEEHPVEMLCLYDGTDALGRRNDLWVFVTSKSSIPGAPAPGKTEFAPSGGLMTASWTAGDKLYLLVASGDEKALQKYLQ